MNFIPNYKNSFRILKGGKISLVVSSFLASTTLSFAAPSGGVVTSGDANISQNGKVTDITQTTQKASINWNKFDIASDETVNFKQPNSTSITLNRVVGNEKSIINGALNANGQVWIINSNGVLFGKGASINTSGLLATTKDISDADFQAGNYKFTGNSKESVINLGTIDVVNNGSVILAANEVKNEGTIKAIRGKIHLAGADEYTVNLNGNSLVNLTVNKGVLDALVKNSGTIIANGGEVYLTTNAVNELLKGVVNNTGVIEANSLAGITGHVELFAHGGTANVAGTINATDGFVETSGDKVKIADDFKVKADKWLIDPTDFTIAASGGDMIGATLSSNLATANVVIESVTGTINTDGKGDIYVNDTISWSSDKKLTLNAQNDIFINKDITSSHADGKLELLYGQKAVATGNTADYYINAPVNLKAGDNFITKLGSNGNAITWTVVTDAAAMQAMTLENNNKNYALGNNITLTGTNNWTPIGVKHDNAFKGNFDGLGHSISNLHINKNDNDPNGLFGYIKGSAIKNIGVLNVNISGKNDVGGLIGSATDTAIKNTYSTGVVSATEGFSANIGGLIGWNSNSSIKNSYSTSEVNGPSMAGGLVGSNYQSNIENSYATGKVAGVNNIGGLIGENSGDIKNSYATGDVTGTGSHIGGLAGSHFNKNIENSYASGSVTGTYDVGGLVGSNTNGTITNSSYDKEKNTAVMGDSATYGKTKAEISASLSGVAGWSTIAGGAAVAGYEVTLLPYLTSVTKDADKSGVTTLFAGGMGVNGNAYTITNWNQLQNINNSNILTKNYYLSLINNLDNLSVGYIGNIEDGWNPIGNASNNFNGTFDGLGFTISNLYINRPTQSYVGLFGYTNNATIKNIGLKDVNIKGNNNVGALVGYGYDIHIENASTSGKIIGNENVGGLIGHMFYAPVTAKKSSSSVDVSGVKNVGGLVGYLDGSAVRESYATGDVSGSENVGGLVGYNNYGSNIENSYAIGEVSGTTNVGGLIGYSNSWLTNTFFDKNTTKQTQGVGNDETAEGVSAKTTAQMQNKETFKDWDIEEDSTILKGTPFLAWQKSGNSYTKIWVIGTKSATPDPVDPKPQDTNKGVEKIVKSIANQTATTVNLPTMETSTTPNNSGSNTNISFSQGENQMLVSSPIEGQSTQRVSLSEARQMQIQNGGSSEEVIVPLSNSSIIQLVDGGVNLPSGVEQEFYLANANTQEEK